ncbi:G2-specific serine/threonine protein kinase [Imshaugia aleurites]|uniref:non-specific serine/threonine protein kinase n=1 Tax=Imshaugia aleurites TaxID=172621 RepID=A0A8H3F5T5_9LECA|nr:G2-specific serine/threonine protein kinase [Imshaugia aleurites]
MVNGLLPGGHDSRGIGPRRTKRPGQRFQPYGAGNVLAERALEVSNPGLETPHSPRRREPDSKTPSEPYNIDEGYDSDPVEAYDVTRDQKAAATAKVSDYEKWGSASAKFIRSFAGLDGGWIGKRPLGAGGFGMAGLWERYDSDGTVIEQMVIKQLGIRKGIWRPEMPMEVKMMRKMEETACPSVVRYIAYRRYLHDQVHRIYMEYCCHGDLKRLYKRYRRFRFVCYFIGIEFESLKQSRLYMPEPFLWDVFYHLVEAAVAMQYGPTEGGWGNHEVVHRDIKPGNVFLDTEDRKSGIPFYPIAKLGDWGLARQTYANDPDNPSVLHLAGTPGYRPPEQREPPLPMFASHPLSILAHTNVWAIGATMFELMTLHRVPGFLLKPRGDITDEEGIKPIQTNRKPPYSSQLSKLIQECLKPIPLDRPNVKELLARIRTHRDAIVRLVREREGAETAKPLEDERLYYVGNEIKWAKTGDWQPHELDRDPNKSEDGFADPDLSPIQYPVFE